MGNCRNGDCLGEFEEFLMEFGVDEVERWSKFWKQMRLRK